MNLPLHFGWLGVLEAALIAMAVGALCYLLFHWLGARHRWAHGHSIAWSSLGALAIAVGIDAWHLFYMGVVKLESPVYARIALQKIHDPNFLATRVFMSSLAAVSGVALAWLALHAKKLRD
ncbi:hypothetical protein [Luteimonas sp. FCS-9]|uniref:hypothetical protein n=1 Tax=Luteimonas sp. FCS-9 TaxID=1547516 RepID=UPI00063E8BF2|nr:hypothetical protein [Luteimonas sp. FCS-9]KLI99766.1 membrane protein [Luteimonas sp. FCS-9]